MSFGPNNNSYWRGGGYYTNRFWKARRQRRQLEEQRRREALTRRIQDSRSAQKQSPFERRQGEETVRGRARLVKIQPGQPLSTLTFQVWPQDSTSGGLLRSIVPVEVKIAGALSIRSFNEGDTVELIGERRDGRFNTREIRNLTTGVTVTITPFFGLTQ